MKKFLVIFMGIFTVLAMSTVAFASDYLTIEELETNYGLPSKNTFNGNPHMLLIYDSPYYYLFYTWGGFQASYVDYGGNMLYKLHGTGGKYEAYRFNPGNGTWDYSPTTGNYGQDLAIIPVQGNEHSDVKYKKYIADTSSDILISIGKTEEEVGTIFFQQPVETPENPEVPEVEIPESGEITQATTLPEIAQGASLETTLLEILGLIPILMAFLVSFLGLKKALKLLSQLLHQS